MSSVLDRPTVSHTHGVLVAQTNFRVTSPEAREWFLSTLTQTIKDHLDEAVLDVAVRTTSVNTILQVEMTIAHDTFTEAEAEVEVVVQKVLDEARDRFKIVQMSTGIHPAA